MSGGDSLVFLRLGLTSFGGPVAHLAYFHEEFVRRQKWVDEAEFADLVALCQFLPGPASSQLVFAIGKRRGGLAGALTASLCFLFPSAVLMILFAYGVGLTNGLGGGILHGLKVAAVAVVALAVWTMGRKLCPDAPRLAMSVAAAAFVIFLPGAWSQVGVVVVGAAVGVVIFVAKPADGFVPATDRSPRRTSLRARGILVVFLVLLLALPLLAGATGSLWVGMFDSFYRAGALVFGGGHVVLPLLRAEVVPPGWVSDEVFLAGYGAAQALPGPLFAFAGFLGTAIVGGPSGWVGGVWGLLAIFLPAWLVIAGALPYWDEWRTKPWAQAALRGANAAVVGLLLAALYNPVWREGVRSWRDIAAVVVALLLLGRFRVPAWVVVVGMGAVGGWLVSGEW